MSALPSSRPTVPFAGALAAHQDQPAIITADGTLSYRLLAERVAATAERLGPHRRLILLAGGNTLDTLVIYLAALASGNPVLPAPPDRPQALRSLITSYDPDVVVHADGTVHERRTVSAHHLHPDLALLLTTSGTTGSPKLVRLSHHNLQSNAEAIAAYLGIDTTDRAATTLPLCYCYGLSVIHSHLLRGAALILTDRSVTDPGFWELFRTAEGTTFAGVPYTFDLLDRIGFAGLRLPHLRYITQAGGRLPADRVARYAALGRRDGWDLVVMYGQTEATARMAYLPAELAESRPQAIGVPIPGGRFRLRPLPDWPGQDTGELVYTGPNVMLGYARTPADLSLGRTVTELHTGDVARRAPDGLYEVIGRRNRFVKLYGLRIDPQRVEERLARHGVTALCTGDDNRFVLAATGTRDDAAIRRLAAAETGLPSGAIQVHLADELPRLAGGKPDYQAVLGLAHATTTVPAAGASAEVTGPADPADPGGTSGPGHLGDIAEPDAPAAPAPAPSASAASVADRLRLLYAHLLDRPDATDDSTFVGLGGDSLSYVEMSLRLEALLGGLPGDWHLRTVRDLAETAVPPPAATTGTTAAAGVPGTTTTARTTRPAQDTDDPGAHPRLRPLRRRTLETGIALRAAAIVLIVGSHIQIFMIRGGAHVLLAVAGFNFARFHLTSAGRRDRRRHVLTTTLRILVPSVTWISIAALLTDDYHLFQALLLNSLLGRNSNYWFIEVIVYILLVLAALLSVPALDRAERRFPFGAPLALLALGLAVRYDLLGVRSALDLPKAIVACWLFPLGWAAARATTARRRVLVTAVAVAAVPGYFGTGQWQREALVVAGLVLLIWVRALPSIGPLNRLAGPLAAATLYIYLSHWQIYPLLDGRSELAALLVSLAAGTALAALARNGRTALRTFRSRRTSRLTATRTHRATHTGGAPAEGAAGPAGTTRPAQDRPPVPAPRRPAPPWAGARRGHPAGTVHPPARPAPARTTRQAGRAPAGSSAHRPA